MKKTMVSVVAIALGMGWMPSASGETLREALAAAYSSNPTLLAQRAALRATDEGVARAISGFRPNISGNVSYSRPDSSSQTTRADGVVVNDVRNITGTSEGYSAQITQPVFRGFQTLNNKRENEGLVRAGRAQLLSTEQTVLLDAVTAYQNVLRDQAVLELNDNNVQVLTRQLQASQDRFRVGEITRTDVAQSEARLAGAVSLRIQAEADLEASRATYRRVIGNYPGTLEPAPDLPPLPTSEDEATEIALSDNPNVQAARYTEEAADDAVDEAKGALLPTIDAFAQWNRNENPTLTFDPSTGGFTDATSVREATEFGVRMTVPLYQSGAEYSDIRRAKQVKSQRRLEIFAAERTALEGIRTAWEQYRAAVASIESNSSQVRANEIALEGVRQEAAVGSRTTLDVLDAEQELLDSRVNLVRAQRNQYVAAFQLLSAMGRLNAVSLDLDVDLYDPEVHYRDVRWKFVGWGSDEGENVPEEDPAN